MFKYSTLPQIEGLITNTYVFALIAALIFLAISMLISRSVAYEGGKNPQDAKKRRLWFIITGVVGLVAFFCYNNFYVSGLIAPVPTFIDKFFMHTAISSGVYAVLYFLLGFVASKLLKNKKFGTIFPSK